MNCRYFLPIDNQKYEKEIRNTLKIELKNYESYLVYEFDENLPKDVFDEVLGQSVEVVLKDNAYLMIEPLHSQFCMRNESLKEVLKIAGLKVNGKVSTCHVFDGIAENDLIKLKKYSVNTVEKKSKKADEYSTFKHTISEETKVVHGFIELNKKDLSIFFEEASFSMTYEDLQYVQNYFIKENRNPTETELKVIDTYWSDHCRHTTFNTVLTHVEIQDFKYKHLIENSLKKYLSDKDTLNRNHKPFTLMDIATQAAKYHRNIFNETLVEQSDEVNACSIVVEIDVSGKEETWLLMFKNETHNHPTEIEPFGGSATCVGGAIRDPLSGRAYVYQAMRLGGSGNILEDYEDTLDHKRAQSYISKTASLGNASYGNQIGLTNTYSRDIFHNSYVAKHMELGAVVGAVKQENIQRGTPKNGDVIVLLGGKTGRDGVGGATGSSVMHDKESIKESSSEVQKGNPHEERKIVRLFRKPEVTKVIIKSNDFGAGGVSVAIGELADGILIDLNKVPLKYEGLNATEIAISESQERMAVVLDPKDVDFFLEACEKEDLLATVVAHVNNSNRLVMTYNDKIYFDIDRDFLDSSGVMQKTDVIVQKSKVASPFTSIHENTQLSLENTLRKLEYTSQKGMIQSFDFSIGQSTVLAPLAGKNQLTENIASVQMFPAQNTHACSVLTHGFIPELSEYNAYLGAYMAVYESVLKTVAVGGNKDAMALSFQEYFNRLTSLDKWGNVLQALLGAYQSQRDLNLSAIGGKDSMSGSFEDLDVVDTFVSFACSKQDVNHLITADLKKPDNFLYMLESPYKDETFDVSHFLKMFPKYESLVNQGIITSAMTTENRSVVLTLIQMSFGNDIGFEVYDENLNIFEPGVLVFESSIELKDFKLIGKTNTSRNVKIGNETLDLEMLKKAYTETLQIHYPTVDIVLDNEIVKLDNLDAKPIHVLVPIFTGTVNEYDLENTLCNLGFTVDFYRINTDNIKESIHNFIKKLRQSDLLILTGDYVPNDELLGQQSIIASFLKLNEVEIALRDFMDDDKKILGLDGGFNALIQTGYLPYGKPKKTNNQFISKLRSENYIADIHCVAKDDVWFKGLEVKDVVRLPMGSYFNHLKLDLETIQYMDLNHNVKFKVNGKIEAMVSTNQNICGVLGHDARINPHTFKTLNVSGRNLFENVSHTFGGHKDA